MTKANAKKIPLPPISVINKIMTYDPDTGVLYHKAGRRHRQAGRPAGTITGGGYLRASINRRIYAVHRIVYAIIHGIDPGDNEIDHIDGDRTNNRPSNLRLATKSQNLANGSAYKSTATGFRGVSYRASHRKFCAQIQVKNQKRHIGYFDTPEKAAIAYDNAASELFGEFARPNFAGEEA
jgi:hypothetical protein